MIQRCLLHSLLLLLAVFFTKHATATQTDELVRLGDSAYVHKAYDSAEYYYTKAAATKNPDALVLYKLGNTHYRLKHIGRAVLAYEHALKRRPGFADAAENIAVIQQRLQPESEKGEVFFIRWWHTFTKPSLSNVWALLGIVCFCIPLAMLAWGRFSRKRIFWLRPQLIGGGITLGILFAVLAAVSINHATDSIAVVMRQDATLSVEFKDRDAGKPVVANLPEGLVVKVLGKEGSRMLVGLPDGREGLMQPSDIVLVE